MTKHSVYIFCVDTEQYSGNFERPMCAYMTGRIGECGVGSDMAELAQTEMSREQLCWFEQHIEPQKDEDHAILRPVTVVPTPGWFNDGLGSAWRDTADATEVHADWLRRVDKEKRTDHFWQDLRKRAPGRHPCYMSVGIYLDEVPPAAIIALLKARAQKFAADNLEGDDVTITGFRLLKQTTTVATEEITL